MAAGPHPAYSARPGRLGRPRTAQPRRVAGFPGYHGNATLGSSPGSDTPSGGRRRAAAGPRLVLALQAARRPTPSTPSRGRRHGGALRRRRAAGGPAGRPAADRDAARRLRRDPLRRRSRLAGPGDRRGGRRGGGQRRRHRRSTSTSRRAARRHHAVVGRADRRQRRDPRGGGSVAGGRRRARLPARVQLRRDRCTATRGATAWSPPAARPGLHEGLRRDERGVGDRRRRGRRGCRACTGPRTASRWAPPRCARCWPIPASTPQRTPPDHPVGSMPDLRKLAAAIGAVGCPGDDGDVVR